MIEPIRTQLRDGVFLTQIRANKYKTGLLGMHLLTPLDEIGAASGALLPSVLRRGTTRYPDMKSLAGVLNELYGAALSCTVRKKGESQCIGFLSSSLDEAFVPGGEHLLEPIADLLGALFLDPVRQENGLFSDAYVESEKSNLIDEIRATMNDKREYADLRLLQEMCRGDRYGIDRLGSEAAAQAITNASLCDYAEKLLSGAQVELYYCGSAEPERVAEALSRTVEALPRKNVVCAVRPRPLSGNAEVRYAEEEMDVAQSKLSVGLRAQSEDDYALMLVSVIFGGYSNSKLFLNVREKLSLCYYASATYHRTKRMITVASGIEQKNYQTALNEIMAQLRAIQSGEIEPWEIEGARNCLISSIRTREDSAARMEDFLLGQAASGIFETNEAMIRALQGVTAERVVQAAQSILPDTVYLLKGKGGAAE